MDLFQSVIDGWDLLGLLLNFRGNLYSFPAQVNSILCAAMSVLLSGCFSTIEVPGSDAVGLVRATRWQNRFRCCCVGGFSCNRFCLDVGNR